ncbi:MAG: patatin-like phospholipase family protein [Acidiferrobacterales bacterium]
MRPTQASQRIVSMLKGASSAFLLVALSWPILGLIGCGTIPRNPVPIEQIPKAEIPNLPGVRSFIGKRSPSFYKDFVQSIRDEPPDPPNPDGLRPYSALVLAGGGPQGAFGAGFLYGWTRAGTRPAFKVVTGISTGALIASFAFVGSDYDEVLKTIFTSTSKKSIVRTRLRRDAVGDSRPLAALIAQYFDDDLIEAIAAEHARGRRLYVGTAHMDAQRLMIWNMGAIARSGHPDAVEIFRKVILASASIPVMMPPVMFEVEVDGKRYDEMHMDGGAVNQLFFLGATVDLLRVDQAVGRPTGGDRVYVIQNGQSDPIPQQVPRNLRGILKRTLATLVKAHRVGDLNRIYTVARLHDIDFSYVQIPSTYVSESSGLFDTSEIKRLFDLGMKLGASEDPWRGKPPFYEELALPSYQSISSVLAP